MRPRPISVVLLGWLFVAVGVFLLGRGLLAFLHDLTSSSNGPPVESDDALWILGSGAWALLGGALLLRNVGWGRWMCAGWMGAHVLLGLGHSHFALLFHALLFVLVVYLLWRPKVRAHFDEASG
jgi:hypothetical protein